MAIETVRRWYDYWRERPGTGRRVNGGGVNIIFSDSNTHHRGAENYRRSGEVDAMRIPKEGFFAHQVMWDGWVDSDPNKPKAHIVGHWNYKAGVTKDVYVISSAEAVELKLNGKSLGRGEPSSRFLFTFKNVAYAPGKLEAVGFNAAGQELCRNVVETTGEPVRIKLTPHVSPAGFKADGSDVALVDVEAVDAQGRRVPTAFNEIRFTLDGPAEWRGGIAQGPGNYILSKTLPVELGVNRVIVRSTPVAGKIRLTAESTGLASASIEWQTQQVDVRAGLSTVRPGEDLKPTFILGPTPAGDSVRPTRTPLTIASVTAGSNQDNAVASYDDNEDSTWSSGGRIKDAWIKYELSQSATVSEITLRLANWRTRMYPIQVLVDDQEVYLGATPRSLGYVTLALKPTKGKTVTVRLIGEPKDRDDFDIVEITGKKLAAGTTDGGNAKGTLKISEAELYGPVVSTSAR